MWFLNAICWLVFLVYDAVKVSGYDGDPYEEDETFAATRSEQLRQTYDTHKAAESNEMPGMQNGSPRQSANLVHADLCEANQTNIVDTGLPQGPDAHPDISFQPDSLGTNISAAVSAGTKILDIAPPSWFLENCVKTSDEIKNHGARLILRNLNGESESDTKREHISQSGSKTVCEDAIEIEAAVYQALYLALSPRSAKLDRSRDERRFRRTSLYLRYPDHSKQPRPQSFFQAVVEHYAGEIGADVVTLQTDDVLDLAQYFASSAEGTKYIDANLGMSMFFDLASKGPEPQGTMYPGYAGIHGYSAFGGFQPVPLNPQPAPSSKYAFPFPRLFKSTDSKKGQGSSPPKSTSAPLVIHVPDIQHYLARLPPNPYAYPIGHSSSDMSTTQNPFTYELPPVPASGAVTPDRQAHILACLLNAMEQVASEMNVLLIATSNDATSALDTDILSLIKSNSRHKALNMSPMIYTDQQSPLRDAGALLHTTRQKNARGMRRSLREHQTIDSISEVLLPYAHWSFLDEIDTNYNFSKRLLRPDELDEIAGVVEGRFTMTILRDAIVGAAWREISLEQPIPATRRASFTSDIQARIARIEASGPELEWEKKVVDLIVTPGTSSFYSYV